MELPVRADNLTQLPLEHYMGLLKEADVNEISQRLGLPWDGRGFTLRVLGRDKHINVPAFDDEGWTDRWRILFGRYLVVGKKAAPMTSFVTYSQMPWGETYNEKFRQRCILRSLSFCPGCWSASPSGRATRNSPPHPRSSSPTTSPTPSPRRTGWSSASTSSAR